MLTHHIVGILVVDNDEEWVDIMTSTDLLRLLRDKEWAVSERIPFRYERPEPLFSFA